MAEGHRHDRPHSVVIQVGGVGAGGLRCRQTLPKDAFPGARLLGSRVSTHTPEGINGMPSQKQESCQGPRKPLQARVSGSVESTQHPALPGE